MGKKSIEDMIGEIEIFIENCKFQPLSSSKIVVPKEDLLQMLDELKMKLPGEIDRCKKIMRNKEAILADARTRADSVVTESIAQANKLVEQSQIVELANIRANEIVETARAQADQIMSEANAQANEVRLGSMYYSKDQVVGIQNFLAATLEAEKANYENLIASLQSELDTVTGNVAELNTSIASMNGDTKLVPEEYESAATAAPEEKFNVYGDAGYSDDVDFDEDDEDYDEDFLDE